MELLNAFGSIFSIVIMIAIGWWLTKKNWMDKSGAKLFAKIVINVALPALMISNLMKDFDRAKLLSLGKGIIVPIISIALTYLIGKTFVKVFNVTKNRRGSFASMFFVSNSIFIGLPVNLALFGSKCVPYVLIYYIVNTTFFWTIGVFEISKDGNGGSNKFASPDTLKRIFSPPLMGFVVAIILILLAIPVPAFLMDTCKYFGNLTTPLSMLFIGNTIYYVNLKGIRFNKDMWGILLGRFIISPLLVVLICKFIPLPQIMKNIFIIQAAMPVMTTTAIVSKSYDADYQYAAIMIALSTLLSLFIIPIYKILL
ncbi:AEC family transporter [Clostridium sp. CF011]|uniref:AEC family transporter n=1 Tax=Clostridium sp. CF011 TaxID=2843318 RepID=UPI001C0B67F4|nr:AEC family transporter [Clostridium sp. CF011]MBU3092023.1 AEC family transporter [Clostridium sp. CF011]WAG71308.1 AEC family transporter [Clostridium sp. CF011]